MENNYEKSLKRLEEIVAELEKGGISLEESLKLFSEGTNLITFCSDYLNKAELKLSKLTQNGGTDE